MNREPVMVMTMQEALDGTYGDDPPWPVVYVIDDGDVVLYVGHTWDVLSNRFRWHYESGSDLGTLWRQCMPDSAQWRVRVYTVHTFDAHHLRRAEAQTIRDLRPCLNGTYNTNATPLPERYHTQQDEMRQMLRRRHTPRPRGV